MRALARCSTIFNGRLRRHCAVGGDCFGLCSQISCDRSLSWYQNPQRPPWAVASKSTATVLARSSKTWAARLASLFQNMRRLLCDVSGAFGQRVCNPCGNDDLSIGIYMFENFDPRPNNRIRFDYLGTSILNIQMKCTRPLQGIGNSKFKK